MTVQLAPVSPFRNCTSIGCIFRLLFSSSCGRDSLGAYSSSSINSIWNFHIKIPELSGGQLTNPSSSSFWRASTLIDFLPCEQMVRSRFLLFSVFAFYHFTVETHNMVLTAIRDQFSKGQILQKFGPQLCGKFVYVITVAGCANPGSMENYAYFHVNLPFFCVQLQLLCAQIRLTNAHASVYLTLKNNSGPRYLIWHAE